MRFRDIPQVTRTPTYQIDVSLSDLARTINLYQIEYKLNLNPDFQRGRVWSMERRSRYVEFILRGGCSASNIFFNCVGWGRFTRMGDFVIVDGKQRIDSCLMFMHDNVPAFGTLCSEFEDRLGPLEPHFRFWINNLETREAVLRWYLEMNEGLLAHTAEEIERVRNMLNEETSQ